MSSDTGSVSGPKIVEIININNSHCSPSNCYVVNRMRLVGSDIGGNTFTAGKAIATPSTALGWGMAVNSKRRPKYRLVMCE